MKFYKTDLYLLIQFLTLVICILVGSYIHPDGFLSPDSTKYLALANNIVNGNGFYVTGFGFSGQEKDFFAIWPVGYPLLIAFIAKLTHLPIFWSSKFLNILMIAFSFILLRTVFKASTYVYGLFFLFGASIVIYSYTWSESVFILALLGYAVAIGNIVKNDSHFFINIILLLLFSCLLFLTRYIGAFSIVSTILLANYCGYKKFKSLKVGALMLVAILNGWMVISYLKNNLTLTQYLTGQPRIPAPETFLELLQQLALAFFSELIIPLPLFVFKPEFVFIVIVQLLVMLFYFRQGGHATSDSAKSEYAKSNLATPSAPIQFCNYSISLFLVGIFYLSSVIALRFFVHFDAFYFRILFPGDILIFIALLRHLEINYQYRFHQIKKMLVALTSFTVLLIPIVMLIKPKDHTYEENLLSIKQKYASIPSGSVMAFGSMHLNYVRNDLLLWSPFSFPYNDKKETWNEYVKRVGANRNIYIENSRDLVEKNTDSSIIIMIQEIEKDKILRVQ